MRPKHLLGIMGDTVRNVILWEDKFFVVSDSDLSFVNR